jgi:hypothetical protein
MINVDHDKKYQELVENYVGLQNGKKILKLDNFLLTLETKHVCSSPKYVIRVVDVNDREVISTRVVKF